MFDAARRAFDLLSRGTLPRGETDRLLTAFQHASGPDLPDSVPVVNAVRLEVLKRAVEPPGEVESSTRLPLGLLHSGLRVASMLPGETVERVTTFLRAHVPDVDPLRLSRHQLAALMAEIGQVTVDVLAEDRQVRITAE